MNNTRFKKGYTPWNKGKKLQPLSDVTKSKIRQVKIGKPAHPNSIHKGENHYNWQGGITRLNDKIRNSLEIKLWRKAVFERDNYACIWCGLKSGDGKAIIIHADHIKPFALFPELRFAIDNGRTLCKECHYKTDTFAGRMKK